MKNYLTEGELLAIKEIASKLDRSEQISLLGDIEIASVLETNADRSIIQFALNHYVRPSAETGQNAYGVEGRVIDSDGEVLSVVLFHDCNDRLLELELIRYADGKVICPNWKTFKIFYP